MDAVARMPAEAAPLTLAATEEALDRLARQSLPDIHDLGCRTYGSEDLAEGVAAFLARRKPAWRDIGWLALIAVADAGLLELA